MKKRIFSFILALALALGMLPLSAFAQQSEQDTSALADEGVTLTNGDYSLTVNKTHFEVGEDIVASVKAPNPSSDWIGIYSVDGISAILWDYASTTGTDTSFKVNEMTQKGGAWTGWYDLPEGRYFIRLMKNGSSEFANSACTVPIIIGTPDVVEGDSSLMSVEKTEFLVGEPIMVSAVGDGTDWVGFYYPGNKQNTKYHYISEAKGGPGSGVSKDVRGGQSFGVGDYIIRLMPNDSSIGNSGNPNASAYVLVSIVESYDDVSTADKFIVEASEDPENPDVGGGGGTTEPENPDVGGDDVDPDNPGGGDDDGDDDEKPSSSVTVSNDTHSLSVNKTQFAVGEEILITATGVSSTDWVGIARRDDREGAIRWYYISSVGNGVEYNIKNAPNIGGNLSAYADIPEGLYTIYLVENDKYLKDTYTFSINISVGDIEDDANGATDGGTTSGGAGSVDGVVAPEGAEYTPSGNGYAGGTVTVTMPTEALGNYNAVMYWADENGTLDGYTMLARVKIYSSIVTHTISKSVTVPSGATRLLVYSEDRATGALSDEFISIDLPENSASGDFGMPNDSIFVISDVHIGSQYGATHFRLMLKDAITLYPNGAPIYIVGDITDNGTEAQYAELMSIFNEVMTENGADGSEYPLFFAIGNHDYPSATGAFLEYAALPDGTHPTDTSYDFWLNGYHYIILGGDNANGLEAYFNEATLTWLDEKLAENRNDARPTFVFLHQSIYNTVAGSLPGEGWDGVTNEDEFVAVIKKYPEVMLFNGHSHWEMDSKGNIFEGTEELPIHAFNCASVSYLWTAFNKTQGENLYGSQGYAVDIYDGKTVVRGRDFVNSKWISSAQYCIEFESSCEHDYDKVAIKYEGGFDNSGKITLKCSICSLEKSEECEKMLTSIGYSVRSDDGNGLGLSGGYMINQSLRALYETLNETKLDFGIIVLNPEYVTADSFMLGGIITSTERALQVSITETSISTVNVMIRGIDEDTMDLDIIISAYIIEKKNDEIIDTSFYQAETSAEVVSLVKADATLYSVSYNSTAPTLTE